MKANKMCILFFMSINEMITPSMSRTMTAKTDEVTAATMVGTLLLSPATLEMNRYCTHMHICILASLNCLQ